MQVTKRDPAPAPTQRSWVCQWVAIRRGRGEWVAGQVSPQELRGNWKAPALTTGVRMLDMQKGKTQGKKETSVMG